MLSRSSYAQQIFIFLFRGQAWKSGSGGAGFFGFLVWFSFFSVKTFGLHGSLEQLLSSLTCIPVAARKVSCPSNSYAVLSLGGSAGLLRGIPDDEKSSESSWFSFYQLKATSEFAWQRHLQQDFCAMPSYPLIQFRAPDDTWVNSMVAGNKCYSGSSGGWTCCQVDTVHENSPKMVELKLGFQNWKCLV